MVLRCSKIANIISILFLNICLTLGKSFNNNYKASTFFRYIKNSFLKVKTILSA